MKYYFFKRVRKKENNVTVIDIYDVVKAQSHMQAINKSEHPKVNHNTEWITENDLTEVTGV